MKLSPQQAFDTGHNLGYSASYFDQVQLASRLANVKTDDAKEHSKNMIALLQKVGPRFAARLRQVDDAAKKLNFPAKELPAIPPDFYPWVQLRHNQFLDYWEATDPIGSIFVLGYCLGEIRNGCIVANVLTDFELHLKLNCRDQIEKIPNRLEKAIERWSYASQIMQNTKPELFHVFQPLSQLIRSRLPTLGKLLSLSSEKEKVIAQSMLQKTLQVLSQSEAEIHVGLPSL